jgi:uncharacterized membrane protein YwaF
MLITAEIFGSKHLMGLLITIVFIALLYFFSETYFKDKPKKVLFVSMILFYVLEVMKISYFWINDGGYPMNHLPFHLCSLPLYLMPLLLFVKSEKLQEYIKPALVAGLLFGSVVALLYPVNIIGDGTSFFPLQDNIPEWISFMYHPLMFFVATYVMYKEIYVIDFKGFYRSFPIIITYMLIAVVVNALLDKDFMLLNYGNGSPLQFMIEEYSPFVYTMTMAIVGLFVMFVFHSIAALFVTMSGKTVELFARD